MMLTHKAKQLADCTSHTKDLYDVELVVVCADVGLIKHTVKDLLPL